MIITTASSSSSPDTRKPQIYKPGMTVTTYPQQPKKNPQPSHQPPATTQTTNPGLQPHAAKPIQTPNTNASKHTPNINNSGNTNPNPLPNAAINAKTATITTNLSSQNNNMNSKQKLSRNPSRESLQSNSPPIRVSSHSKHCRRIELLRMKKIKDPVVVSMRKRLAAHSSMIDLSNASLHQMTETSPDSIVGPLIASKLRAVHPSRGVLQTEMDRPRTEWSLMRKLEQHPTHQSISDFKGWTFSTWKSADIDSKSIGEPTHPERQDSLKRYSHHRANSAGLAAVSLNIPKEATRFPQRIKKQELATSLVGLFVEEAVRSRLSGYIQRKSGKPMARTFNYPKQQKSDEIFEGRDDIYKQIYIYQLHEKFRLKHGGQQMSLIPARYKTNDPFRSTPIRGFMSSENLLLGADHTRDKQSLEVKHSELSHKEYSFKYQGNPEITIPHISLPGSTADTKNSKRSSVNGGRRIITAHGGSKQSLNQQANKGFSVTAHGSPLRKSEASSKGGLLVPDHLTDGKNDRGSTIFPMQSGFRPGWRSPALVGWLPPGQTAGEHELSNSGLSLREISSSHHKQTAL